MWRRARVRVTSLLVGSGVGIAAALQTRPAKPYAGPVPARTLGLIGDGQAKPESRRPASPGSKRYAGQTYSLRSSSSLAADINPHRSIDTPVLIVGAGPVGAYLSLLLSRYGVPNVLVSLPLRAFDSQATCLPAYFPASLPRSLPSPHPASASHLHSRRREISARRHVSLPAFLPRDAHHLAVRTLTYHACPPCSPHPRSHAVPGRQRRARWRPRARRHGRRPPTRSRPPHTDDGADERHRPGQVVTKP